MISSESCRILGDKLSSGCDRVYCRGLFLSAKWFVLSQTAARGLHLVVLPDKETAEYCTSDLYNLIEGDKVFFLPESGKNVERSNYKSSLAVQRTAAIGAVMSWKKDELKLVVSYPEALEERVPSARSIKDSVLKIKAGQEISHDSIVEILSRNGFEKVDFVSAPGQYAIRGSIVDIFSYSWNYPYRISFWGNEVEKINIFDSGLDDVVIEMCKYVTCHELGKDVRLKFFKLGGADSEMTFTYPEDGQMQMVEVGFKVYEDCAGIVNRNPAMRQAAAGLSEINQDWLSRFFA